MVVVMVVVKVSKSEFLVETPDSLTFSVSVSRSLTIFSDQGLFLRSHILLSNQRANCDHEQCKEY